MPIKVTVNPNGRMSLPTEVLEHLGLSGGGTLLVDETGDGVKLRTIPQAIAHSQAHAMQFTTGHADASVNAFLARRREESGE